MLLLGSNNMIDEYDDNKSIYEYMEENNYIVIRVRKDAINKLFIAKINHHDHYHADPLDYTGEGHGIIIYGYGNSPYEATTNAKKNYEAEVGNKDNNPYSIVFV